MSSSPRKQLPAGDKPLPFSMDAETSILGAMILNNTCIIRVREKIRAEDFFHDSHRRIFKTMLEMESASQPIDIVTLMDRLHSYGDLETAGGQAFISRLVDGVPRVSHVETYCKIVKEKSVLRNLAHLGNAIKTSAIEEESAEGLIAKVQENLSSIQEGEIDAMRGAITIKEAIVDSMETFERIASGEGTMLGVPTGYKQLDQQLAGWIPGELVILGARPSMGKTALALEFAYRQAKIGNPVAVFSMETSRVTLLIRMICARGKVDGHRFRTGHITKEDWQKIKGAITDLSDLPIWIDDRPSMTVEQFRYRLKAMAQRNKIRFAILDYIQLLGTQKSFMSLREQMTHVSKEVKAATRELGEVSNGTMLALSQLSRIKDERPRLDHLRETGQLEQDSDVVIFIHAPKAKKKDEEEPEPEAPLREIIIAKQKNGPQATLKMAYIGKYMQFEQVTPDWDDPSGE